MLGELDTHSEPLHDPKLDSEMVDDDIVIEMQKEGSTHTAPASSPNSSAESVPEPGSPGDGLGSTPGSKRASSPSFLGEVVWIGICAVLWRMHPTQKFTFTLEMADVISDFLFWWFLDEGVGGTRIAVLIFATIGLILQCFKIMVIRRSFMEGKDLWDMTQREIYLGYVVLLLEDIPQLILVFVISADEGYDSFAQLTLILSLLSILWKVLQQILLKMEFIIMDETDQNRGWFTQIRHEQQRQTAAPSELPMSPRRTGEDVTAMSILKDKFYDLTDDHKTSDAITTCILGFVGDLDKGISEEEEREWSVEIKRQRHDRAIANQFVLEDKEAKETGPYQDLIHVRLLQSKNGPVGVSTLNGKFVALYFGGSWCPACISYYPKLIKAYNAVKAAGHDNFEIVFISSDRDETAFNHYFEKHPWLAVPYAARYVKKELSSKWNVTRIPTIMFLDGDAKVYEEDGYNKILKPENFPWNQLPPEIQAVIDATQCEKKLAQLAIDAAYGDLNRAVEYVFAANEAQDIPEKAIVEIVQGFPSDYERDPRILRQGERLAVLKVDEGGDIAVMHLEANWRRHAWIARWNFAKLRVLTKEVLLKEKKDAEKKMELERMATIDLNESDNPPTITRQLSEFANRSSGNVLTIEEDPKPMLKKRSTMQGSINEEYPDLDVEELVTVLIQAMGEDLSREKAREVLNACNGDMEEALGLLLTLDPKNDSESLCAENGICHPRSPDLGDAPPIKRDPENQQGDPATIEVLE